VNIILNLILFLTFLFSCAAQQINKKTDFFISDHLEKPTQIAKSEIPSRYWVADKFLVHFISNANEENKNMSPVIYIHGLGGSLEDFSEIINTLHPTNSSAPYYALDLPPFGKSFMNKSELSIHRYSELLEKFISMFTTSKVNLVCHSMGGQVCIDFSLNHPDKVQLLTLIDAAGVYERSTYINQTLNHYAGINVGPISNATAASPSDLAWYNQNFTKKLITNNPLILMAIESYKENFHGRIKQLKTKTLIFWGHDDTVFNFENGLYLKENIEDSKLYIIEHAGHFPLKSHAEFISNIIQKNL
jgi:2-hydroxy-6-oxonona-2,4-dienedioate hydrolase